MFEVAAGDKEERRIERDVFRELELLAIGAYRKTIFLNGGSDTRKAAAEYWLGYAAKLGVPARRVSGCLVEIGYADIDPR